MILKINCYLMIILCLGIMERTRGCIRNGLEVWRTGKGAQVKEEAQNESSLFRNLGPTRSKTDTQDESRLRFLRSTHGDIGLSSKFLLSHRKTTKQVSQRPKSVSVLHHYFCSVGEGSRWQTRGG